jgi:hypothetical protein
MPHSAAHRSLYMSTMKIPNNENVEMQAALFPIHSSIFRFNPSTLIVIVSVAGIDPYHVYERLKRSIIMVASLAIVQIMNSATRGHKFHTDIKSSSEYPGKLIVILVNLSEARSI